MNSSGYYRLLFWKLLAKYSYLQSIEWQKIEKKKINCHTINCDVIETQNHNVSTQNDEKHLHDSCSKISEQYLASKKRYCQFNPSNGNCEAIVTWPMITSHAQVVNRWQHLTVQYQWSAKQAIHWVNRLLCFCDTKNIPIALHKVQVHMSN